MVRIKDITGKKFGRLTAIRYSHTKNTKRYWLFRCDCGVEKTLINSSAISGNAKSCGCMKKGVNKKHGLCDTRVYHIYTGIKRRCYNKNIPQYNDWGGRGIKVCKEWKEDFNKFYDWSMANGYDENLSIDRIDNDGNYEPSNCRWTTRSVQSSNTRIRSNNTSGYTGIGWSKDKGRWTCYIQYKGKIIYYDSSSNKEYLSAMRNKFIIDNNLPHRINTIKGINYGSR